MLSRLSVYAYDSQQVVGSSIQSVSWRFGFGMLDLGPHLRIADSQCATTMSILKMIALLSNVGRTFTVVGVHHLQEVLREASWWV